MYNELGCENMKFMRKHKIVIWLALILVLLLCGAMIAKEFFFSNDNVAIYGTRLSKRKEVPITEKVQKNIKKEMKAETASFDMRIQGRIIEINMTVKEDTTLEAAKELGNKTLEYFSDKEKAYYDIQLIIQSKKETNQFPIIGYKHHNREAISWTYDRAES